MNISANHKKILAILICVLFIASILLSMTYIAKESNHVCLDGHCPICINIQMAAKTIGQLGTAFVLAMTVGFSFIVCVFIFKFMLAILLSTPITQNIRMNN